LSWRGPLALAAASLAGCAGPGGPAAESPFARGLWPVYSADAAPWAGFQERRALGPLLHWETRGSERRFEARPLLSRLERPDLLRSDVLYPLWARRATPERVQSWLLVFGRTRRDADAPVSEATLGVAFRGRTADGAGYSGLFPIYGRFRERLGLDRLTFALWPLWARAERGEYRETQVLWPVFALGRGGGRFKLRIWPLFGVDRRDGVSDHRYFLWPFFHLKRDHLETRSPSRAFYALPIYGHRDRGPRHSRFYLFPLLARQWHDEDPDSSRLDLLWPLFSRARDGEDSLLALRPFYAERRTATGHGRTWLLGLYGRSQSESGSRREERWRVLWLARFARRADGEAWATRADVWPLFRRTSRRDADGAERGFLRLPWLLPLQGLDPDGWDRHYNKLFELYGATWLGEQRRSSTLFGLRETRSGPAATWVQWGGWLSYRRAR
jgi:hypothetical protein